MKLNGKAFGIAWGVIWGGTIFLASLSVVLRQGTGEFTNHLGRFYIGYDSTKAFGAFVGLVYGFIHAFIMGVIFAAIYNSVVASEKTPEISPKTE